MLNLFVSLFLTACMSFVTPVITIGCMLGLLNSIGYVPRFLNISKQGTLGVLNFLAVFGNGKPFQGIVTLGITAGVVGILLNIFNFYRYQIKDKDFN